MANCALLTNFIPNNLHIIFDAGDRANFLLYKELWHACAGPLVTLPEIGERVYYFPQGHIEQVHLQNALVCKLVIYVLANDTSECMILHVMYL